MRVLALVTLILATLVVEHCFAGESADKREYWAYEGGWFARTKSGSWYELNEEAFRNRGKAWSFREVRRVKEYVEIYDAGRKVRASAHSG